MPARVITLVIDKLATLSGKFPIALLKELFQARRWWLMPVILATQKAEIRKITVQSQSRQGK
jgi:hypothetical protein